MADIVRCKTQLLNLYTQQPTLENYLSKLTRQARGEQKADCLQAFGTIQDVQHFLLHPEDIQLVPELPTDTATTVPGETTQQPQPPKEAEPVATTTPPEHAVAQATGELQT